MYVCIWISLDQKESDEGRVVATQKKDRVDSPDLVILDDDINLPKSKKRKVESDSSEEDCIVVAKSIPAHKTEDVHSSPLFYLTKVRGISDVFNRSAVGIKGNLSY